MPFDLFFFALETNEKEKSLSKKENSLEIYSFNSFTQKSSPGHMGTTKHDKNEKGRMEYDGLLESGDFSRSKSFIFNRDDISSSKQMEDRSLHQIDQIGL